MEQTMTQKTSKTALPKLRRLKFNELVREGDYVANEHHKFERWEGLTGFRAAAFVKPIYRQNNAIRRQQGK
jgi:hypothetical protein